MYMFCIVNSTKFLSVVMTSDDVLLEQGIGIACSVRRDRLNSRKVGASPIKNPEPIRFAIQPTPSFGLIDQCETTWRSRSLSLLPLHLFSSSVGQALEFWSKVERKVRRKRIVRRGKYPPTNANARRFKRESEKCFEGRYIQRTFESWKEDCYRTSFYQMYKAVLSLSVPFLDLTILSNTSMRWHRVTIWKRNLLAPDRPLSMLLAIFDMLLVMSNSD